ncbi:MAG: segregation/condensation protein A [Candidatus Omnitrophica bacterium]|nr:segregation/condensation protein A [Candidatus Omnitrophota bacterium]
MQYKIKLDIFEGPLDLLLYLIQKNELDIHDIPIVLVTEQYLEYLNLMQALNLDLAGEYLVMASTLMKIKSRLLLPQEEPGAEAAPEEDPRDELVQKLVEYMRYKEAAQQLREMEQMRSRSFSRHPQPLEIDFSEVGSLVEVSIFDLITAFSKVLESMPREVFHQVIRDEYTVAEKVHELLHLLVERSRVRFGELFGQARNRLEAITVFLALLELVRLKEVQFEQESAFGEIQVMRNPEHHAPPQRTSEEEAPWNAEN